MRTVFVPGEIRRPSDGLTSWVPIDSRGEWQPTEGVAWRSNGGASRAHPDRSLPLSLEIQFPEFSGAVTRIHLVGVFALYASAADESVGMVGAQVQFLGSGMAGGAPFSLLNGSHYLEATDTEPVHLSPGDGATLETVGSADWNGQPVRVDRLSIDLPAGLSIHGIKFVDMGTPASFALFDAYFEAMPEASCPFAGRSSGISLAELGVAVRVGDRVRATKALDQLHRSIRAQKQDLDESRGSVLLFLAVVSAAKLEAGTRRPLHRFQLDAARELERAHDVDSVVKVSDHLARELIGDLLEDKAPTDLLVNRALNMVERGYGRHISDEDVAQQLSLSTSHFRHLFKQTTGQPFHQYVIAIRLEKARALLAERGVPVSEVAQIVGFQSPAHFSRAFQKRFGVAPNAIRNAVRTESV